MSTYSELLRRPEWQAKRAAVIEAGVIVLPDEFGEDTCPRS